MSENILHYSNGAQSGSEESFSGPTESGSGFELFTPTSKIIIPNNTHNSDVGSVNFKIDQSDIPLNEIGNGKRFAEDHGAEMRYCSTDETWRFYRQGIWHKDVYREAEKRAKATAQKAAAYAAREPDEDKRSRLLKHADTLTRHNVRMTMLKDAMSEEGMTVSLDQFDVDMDIFNCSNGTLNLRTGEFWSHRPADFLTRQSPVAYNSLAECPLWDKCVQRWLPEQETREFVQELMGITLSGRIYEELFVFLYGAGANGKSKFLGVFEYILGTYFHKTKAETIMQFRQKRNPGAPSPEILGLKGSRLVTTQEIDDKQEINTALIKDLTGSDIITARGIYEKHETSFLPQYTLWTFGNGKPTINDPSGGMWRRPKLINFGPPITKSERDPLLGEKLKNEAAGILNWMLVGLARVETRGGKLITPFAVEEATKSYRHQQDHFSEFLDERCLVGSSHSAAFSEIFEAWREWCNANDYEVETERSVGMALGKRGSEFTPCKVSRFGKQVRGWRGIDLASK